MANRRRNDKLRSMPSSNFFRRRLPVYLALALALGKLSPSIGRLFDFVTAANRQGLLYWWFMGVPAEVYAWIGPSERYQQLVWSGVFTLQYLLIFAAGVVVVMLFQRRGHQARQPVVEQAPPERVRAFEAPPPCTQARNLHAPSLLRRTDRQPRASEYPGRDRRGASHELAAHDAHSNSRTTRLGQ